MIKNLKSNNNDEQMEKKSEHRSREIEVRSILILAPKISIWIESKVFVFESI